MRSRLKLTQSQVDLFRQHRFFSGFFRNPDDYLSGRELGWIKPGLRMKFNREISIEPYSGIYNGRYAGSKGRSRQHGLCSIGSFSYSHSPLPEAMRVGRYCSISTDLRCLDYKHPIEFVSTSVVAYRRSMLAEVAVAELGGGYKFNPPSYPDAKPADYPVIGHDVWIGQDVRLKMGISIGTGAVIAANTVVTRDVPPYAIIAGNPGRVKRLRFPEEQVAELLASEWWNYAFTDLRGLPFDRIPDFLNGFNGLKSSLKPYAPKTLNLPGDLLALGPQPPEAVQG